MNLRLLPTLIAIACLMMAACSDEEPISVAYTDYRYDIVTYQGQNNNGALFDCIGRNDSGSVVLQSTVDVSSNVKVGQRALLRYNYNDQSASGGIRTIDVYGCDAIFTDTLRRTAAPLSEYPMHEVKLRSLWRTGGYLNLYCQMEYTPKAQTLLLVADSATLEADTVQCYLIHDLRGQEGTFWRNCFASFYVGGLWQRPSCKAIRVHLNDVTYPDVKHYDFFK